MRKLGLVLGVLTIFALTALAFGQQENGDANAGYGIGHGMMRGYGGSYGMGPGLMGPGYGQWHNYILQSPECNKFYDDTIQLRKQLHDKQFEYLEIARNPKTTGAQLSRIEAEVRDLQNQIYLKAPLGCRW